MKRAHRKSTIKLESDLMATTISKDFNQQGQLSLGQKSLVTIINGQWFFPSSHPNKAQPTTSVMKGQRRKGKKPKGDARQLLWWWEGQRDDSGNGGMQNSRMQDTRKVVSKEGMGTCDQWAHIIMKP